MITVILKIEKKLNCSIISSKRTKDLKKKVLKEALIKGDFPTNSSDVTKPIAPYTWLRETRIVDGKCF